MKKYFALSLLIFMAFYSKAQIEEHDIDIMKEMAQQEQEIIEALALYPKDIRELIFEASTYPEIIIKIANVQTRTSSQFKELMQKYPEEVQKGVWEMTRYPGLIEKLVKDPENSDKIIGQYPKEIHEQSKAIVGRDFALLKEVDKLNASSQATFTKVVSELPEKSQKVFSQLIKYPEILDLLNQNIELTVLGGDFYKKAPDLVRHHADSLNLVVTRQQALELEDWKQQLENDPQAAEELKQATIEFAEEYGYDEDNITAVKEEELIDDLYYDDAEYEYDEEEVEARVVEYYYYNYPYWFGYPYWYGYPYWRPYPFWFEWGFYWGPYGSMMIYHMPSPYFMYWYFGTPYHHYQYPYFSNHCINHYYGHRYSGSSVVGAVSTWRKTNREVVKDDWLTNESKRVPALKEFGKMEDARDSYNNKHPKENLTSSDYLNKNERKYPYLKQSINKPETKYTDPVPEKDVRKPKDMDIKTVPPKVSDLPGMPKQPAKKEKPVIRLKKAEDYHKQTWQRNNPKPQQSTRPRVFAPSKSTPKSSPGPTKSQSPRGKKN